MLIPEFVLLLGIRTCTALAAHTVRALESELKCIKIEKERTEGHFMKAADLGAQCERQCRIPLCRSTTVSFEDLKL